MDSHIQINRHNVREVTVTENALNSDLLALAITESAGNGAAAHAHIAAHRDVWQQVADKLAEAGVTAGVRAS